MTVGRNKGDRVKVFCDTESVNLVILRTVNKGWLQFTSWFPLRLMFHHGITELGKPGGRGGFNKKDKKFDIDLVILRCFCFI